MNKPFFSIITCTLNSDQYINKNIQSVRSQCFKNYEHIIIDGYSKDLTMDIINRYRFADNQKVIVKKQKPKGVTAAFNKGIGVSKGKYVIHLNSDDYLYDNNVLNDVYIYLKKNTHLDWIFGKVVVRTKKGVKIGTIPHFNFMGKYGKFILRMINVVPHQSVFIKKDIFNKFGLFDRNIKYLPDYEYWLRICNKTKWEFLDRVIAVFIARHNSVSMSERNMVKNKIETIKYHTKYCSSFESILFQIINYNFIIKTIRKLRNNFVL